ncbi:MAG: PLP-dependent aminotransferase family protein [Lautropia sp.]|nr:PLP-dependent aminotransferase family protein [Lautropia sp.]
MEDRVGSRHVGVMWQALFDPFRHQGDGLSLQERVRQMLVAAILDGLLPPLAFLPSTRELSQALGVSRNTVIIVYQRLCDEGYLVPRAREGYFVAAEIPSAHWPDVRHQASPTAAAVVPDDRDRRPDWSRRLRLPPSAQRNIQKRTDWRRYPYPFLYGQFDAGSFPMADWRHCCLRTLSALEVNEWGHDMFLKDDPLLIRQVKTRLLPQRGIQAGEENILMTVGSQHGLYLLADLLMDRQSRVAIEEPGYPDARNIFLRRRATLVGVPVDRDGMMLDAALQDCDYVHVTPSHQCPTTVTMPIERRLALLDAAVRHDFVMIEDDYESENNWQGEPMPALKSLDRHDRVIYLGSFSKSFAPGLRLGYVVGPEPLIAELRAMRRLNLRHPNTFMQRSLAMFLAMGHYHRLQRRLSDVHAERAETLMQAMVRHLPAFQVVPSKGGSAVWVSGPPGFDAGRLAREAEQAGVLIEAGDVFFRAAPQPCPHFRLGFTSIQAREIEPGIRQLADVVRSLG